MTLRYEHGIDRPYYKGGNAWYLEEPEDYDALPPRAKGMISARQLALFRTFPDSVVRLAEQAPLPAMRRWLQSLVDARCELEVHRSRTFWDDSRLRFRFDERWAPSFRAASFRAPPRCPPVLLAVHRLIGDTDVQWGCSGTLMPLSRVRSLDALRCIPALNEIPRSERRALRTFYEVDGDYLCFDADERTCWTGHGEWGPMGRTGRSVAQMLDQYFDRLLARKLLHA